MSLVLSRRLKINETKKFSAISQIHWYLLHLCLFVWRCNIHYNLLHTANQMVTKEISFGGNWIIQCAFDLNAHVCYRYVKELSRLGRKNSTKNSIRVALKLFMYLNIYCLKKDKKGHQKRRNIKSFCFNFRETSLKRFSTELHKLEIHNTRIYDDTIYSAITFKNLVNTVQERNTLLGWTKYTSDCRIVIC